MFFNKKNLDQSLIPEKQRELPKIEQPNQIKKKEAPNIKIKKNSQSNKNSNENASKKEDIIEKSIQNDISEIEKDERSNLNENSRNLR